jgi:hypothetical protein
MAMNHTDEVVLQSQEESLRRKRDGGSPVHVVFARSEAFNFASEKPQSRTDIPVQYMNHFITRCTFFIYAGIKGMNKNKHGRSFRHFGVPEYKMLIFLVPRRWRNSKEENTKKTGDKHWDIRVAVTAANRDHL